MSLTSGKLYDDEAWLSDHAALTRLFSYPGVTAQLLQEFFEYTLPADLNQSSLQPVKVNLKVNWRGSFQSVLNWRIMRPDGGHLYVLLLLALRPTSDRYIALRVLDYVSQLLFWDAARKQCVAHETMPAVVQIVLYTGEVGWSAPRELGQLIAPSLISDVRPEQRYYVVDATGYTDEKLRARSGLPALWLRLLAAGNREQIAVVTDEAQVWFAGHPEFSNAAPIFADILAMMSVVLEAPIGTGKP